MSYSLSAHDQEIIRKVREIVPDLNEVHHKGQHGRIGIIGGSEEYTGAPYFAGISSLRVGADLVHIFCSKGAAQPIKSYSPDLIVHPLLNNLDAVEEVAKWLSRLHVIVIGPGLGSCPTVLNNVKEILKHQEMANKFLVVDADGLKLSEEILRNPGLTGILTPNAIEFQRLNKTILNERFTLLAKGPVERILSYRSQGIFESGGAEFPGSGRRCGGQGDLLSGAIATFYHWATMKEINEPAVVACQGASLLVRLCNARAVEKRGRGTLAADMIEEITGVFKDYFERKE